MNLRKEAVFGVVLVAISLIIGAIQDIHIYNFYGDASNKWYFYGVIGVILLVGIVLVAWGLLRKEKANRPKT